MADTNNPLRSPDPKNPLAPHRLIDEVQEGTRHPNRFEPKTASVPNTSLVRLDAARVYRNTALSLATGAIVSFDSLTTDTTGLWNGSTTFTIPSTGKVTGAWLIKAQIAWPVAGAGTFRQIQIMRNGIALSIFNSPVSILHQSIDDIVYDPNKGDAFTIVVTHDAGAPVAINTGSINTFFSMVHTG